MPPGQEPAQRPRARGRRWEGAAVGALPGSPRSPLTCSEVSPQLFASSGDPAQSGSPKHSPSSSSMAALESGATCAQGTARGLGQRTRPGDSAGAWRQRRCTAPPPRHPSRQPPRAPRPRPAPRRPVSKPGPHCSREKTLQPGQPRAQLVPRVLSWPVLQPCPLTLRHRELVPTPFLPCPLRSLLHPALVTPATPNSFLSRKM